VLRSDTAHRRRRGICSWRHLKISSRVSIFTSAGIDDPFAITTGPDGALWFTSLGNNSIGRITTRGRVNVFRDERIDQPVAITPGPDGALWFTNASYQGGKGSIGRITTAGIVSIFPLPPVQSPWAITVGG
jgi:virginiamycin B lyase